MYVNGTYLHAFMMLNVVVRISCSFVRVCVNNAQSGGGGSESYHESLLLSLPQAHFQQNIFILSF